MENTNMLVPSAQKIIIQGILKEKKLEVKSGEKGEYITGNIVVKSQDESTVAVRFFANRYITNKETGERKENNFFTHLVKVRDTYVSEAEIAKNNLTDKKPTVVSVSGAKFDKNDYYNTKTNITVQGVCVQGLGVYEVDGSKPISESIVFELTAYLYKMADEVHEGMPTGRKKCTLLFPVYAGKLAQMEVTATQVVSDFLQLEGVGNTYKFQGIIKNTVVATQQKSQCVGEQYMRPVTTIIRENLLTCVYTDATGSGALQEGMEGYMNPEAVKLAIAEREANIAQMAEAASKATINDIGSHW